MSVRHLSYLYFPMLLLGVFSLGTFLPTPGECAPTTNRLRLVNPIDIALPEVVINDLALLSDNESLVVVGGKPRGTKEEEMDFDNYPAAGGIVNLRTKSVVPFTNGHSTRILSVARSADGLRVYTTNTKDDPVVRIWDVKAAKSITPVPVPKDDDDPVRTFDIAAFHRDQRLAITLNWWVTLVDPIGGVDKEDLKAGNALFDGSPRKLAISADDKYLACSTYRSEVVVWDVKTRKVLYNPNLVPLGAKGRESSIHTLGFTRDGKRLLVARSVRTDEVPKGTPEEMVQADKRGMYMVDFENKEVIPLGMGHQCRTLSFALHPTQDWIVTVGGSRPDKGKLLMTGELRVYQLSTRTLALRLQFADDFSPFKVKFTSDGKRLIAVQSGADGPGGKVRVWDFLSE